MADSLPEAKAREQIDAQLTAAGWTIQDYTRYAPAAARGIALREIPVLGRGWVWNGELPECIHQNHVFRARLLDSALSPKFLSWYANSIGQKFFFDEGKHTTNFASISMSKLKALPVPIPPPAEEKRIVTEVERLLSTVDAIEATLSVNLQRAVGLRQSVLQKAFSGAPIESRG
jgi:type I restriction enzyme S subunit